MTFREMFNYQSIVERLYKEKIEVLWIKLNLKSSVHDLQRYLYSNSLFYVNKDTPEDIKEFKKRLKEEFGMVRFDNIYSPSIFSGQLSRLFLGRLEYKKKDPKPGTSYHYYERTGKVIPYKGKLKRYKVNGIWHYAIKGDNE